MLVLISGPSGSGKTTVAKKLAENYDDMVIAVSHTTRPMRPGEKDGIDYYFIDKKTFAEMLENGEFVEYFHFHGNDYGMSYAELERILSEGKNALVVIYPTMAEQFQIYCQDHDCIKVYLTAPIEELIRRIKKRGGNSKEIQQRIENLYKELEDKQFFNADITIDNLNSDVTVEILADIIRERSRKAQIAL